jgi:hypothetical protein
MTKRATLISKPRAVTAWIDFGNTSSTDHIRHIPIFTHKLARQSEIASEEQYRYDGGNHHIRIFHLALRIFMLVQRLQKIIAQAKYCHNLSVQAILQPSFSLVTVNCTGVRMDIAIHST